MDEPLLDLYLENVLPVRKSLFIEQSICSLNQFVRRCEIVLIKISVSNEDRRQALSATSPIDLIVV